MTTIKELADELGVSKTTITKYVKEEMQLQTQPRRAVQLSANQCSEIANHFSALGLVKQVSTANQTANQTARGVQLRADENADVQLILQENAALKERVAGLERENELLRERLEVADAALEREQLQARGFWSRLGQKLLDGGTVKHD